MNSNITFCLALTLVSIVFQYLFVGLKKFSLSYARYIIYGSVLACWCGYCIDGIAFFKVFLALYFIGMSIVYIKYNQIDLNTPEIYGKYSSFLLGTINIISLLLAVSNSNSVFIHIALILYLLPIIIWWLYFHTSKAAVTADTIVAIAQTNITEVKEYFQAKINIYNLFFLLGSIVGVVCFLSNIPKLVIIKTDKLIYVKLFALVISNIWLIRKNMDNFFMEPFFETYEYIKSINKFGLERKIREKKIVENLKKYANISDGVYVLVIGESQNREHMSFYGYERQTTPWLDKQKNNQNFVFLSKAFSSYPQTVRALAYALTAKNQYNSITLEEAPSIVEVANSLGFKTIWISNQMKYGVNSTSTSIIAGECREDYWLNATNHQMKFVRAYDGEILKYLKNITLEDKTLIVLHLTGNHELYELRYPKEYNVFGETNLIDCYDNSMLYNDYVVSQFLEEAKKMPNFKSLIYVADHSEDVDNGLDHDSNKFTMAMVKIPMWFYFSDSYIENHEEIVANIRSSKDKCFTNDLLFDCMMSLMGVKLNSFYDECNDITSRKYDDTPTRFKTMYGKVNIN